MKIIVECAICGRDIIPLVKHYKNGPRQVWEHVNANKLRKHKIIVSVVKIYKD